VAPETPRRLAQVVSRLLEREPADRYASALATLAALPPCPRGRAQLIEHGERLGVLCGPVAARTPARRSRAGLGVAALAGALAAAGLWWAVDRGVSSSAGAASMEPSAAQVEPAAASGLAAAEAEPAAAEAAAEAKPAAGSSAGLSSGAPVESRGAATGQLDLQPTSAAVPTSGKTEAGPAPVATSSGLAPAEATAEHPERPAQAEREHASRTKRERPSRPYRAHRASTPPREMTAEEMWTARGPSIVRRNEEATP
jgi:hypothetical protein